jgi:hypothetical protein
MLRCVGGGITVRKPTILIIFLHIVFLYDNITAWVVAVHRGDGMLCSDSLVPHPYNRPASMAWLAGQFAAPAFHNDTPFGRAALIAWLERRCRTMRAQGISGAWHYDLPLHTELLRILAAEKAELAAIEIRSASTDADRWQQRAA